MRRSNIFVIEVLGEKEREMIRFFKTDERYHRVKKHCDSQARSIHRKPYVNICGDLKIKRKIFT